MFFQITRKTILLLFNNIHENASYFFTKKLCQPFLSLLKTPKCLFLCIISAGNRDLIGYLCYCFIF